MDRYKNYEEIIQGVKPEIGLCLSLEDLRILSYDTGVVKKLPDTSRVNLHLYNLEGVFLNSFYSLKNTFDGSYNDFLVELSKVLVEKGVEPGDYRSVLTFDLPIFGTEKSLPFFLKEISSDRTEIKLVIRKAYLQNFEEVKEALEKFKDFTSFLKASFKLFNLTINFLENRTFNCFNIKIECKDDLVVYVKFIEPLPDTVFEKDLSYFGFKVAEDYVYSLSIKYPQIVEEVKILQGPTPELNVKVSDAGNTHFRSWDGILGPNIQIAAEIISKIFSGSGDVNLNIDYTSFSNFVQFSSAEERVRNFDYKLRLIDHYVTSSAELLQSNVSSSAVAIQDIHRNVARIEAVKGDFDGFEQYLYYGSQSYFSYDITGSITPTPKYLNSSGSYVPYNTSTGLYTTWYNSLLVEATQYDSLNTDRLFWATPDHILRDENNSQYVLFLALIGQHFDNLYSFIRSLTKIHEKDEHLKRGIPNSLLRIFAESFGWELSDGNSLSNLWQYRKGLSTITSSFSYDYSNSVVNSLPIPDQPHEYLTFQIWKRIVNNLPYLLKSKATAPSIRALFSSYGIPYELITVREYGGPVYDDIYTPNFYEDRYYYSVLFSGSAGICDRLYPVTHSFTGDITAPKTYEFRFKTGYKTGSFDSSSLATWVFTDLVTPPAPVLSALELVPFSGSYSGSNDYGRLKFRYNLLQTSSYSEYLPLFDNDFWSVRLEVDDSLSTYSNILTGSVRVDVQKASDFTDGRISISSSFEALGVSTKNFLTASDNSYTHLFLGGAVKVGSLISGSTTSLIRGFSGSLGTHKRYLSRYPKYVFDRHTLDPMDYSTNIYSSSWHDLHSFMPLGGDRIRDEIFSNISPAGNTQAGSYVFLTSSYFGMSSNYLHRYQEESERFYTFRPSFGSNNVKNLPIRLESSRKIRELSPEARADVGSYDYTKRDSNRLVVATSPTDQFNRDVIHSLGPFRLDDFVGDPEWAQAYTYNYLNRRRREYYKKYTYTGSVELASHFNPNTYIEFFSLYDYSVFEQVKQLTPARANLIAGILLEPTYLERYKHPRKEPEIELLDYDTTLTDFKREIFGENIEQYTGSISRPVGLHFLYQRYNANLNYSVNARITQERYSTYLSSSERIAITYSRYNTTLSNTGSEQVEGEVLNYDTSTALELQGSLSRPLTLGGECLNFPEVIESSFSFSYKKNGVLRTYTGSRFELAGTDSTLSLSSYYRSKDLTFVGNVFTQGPVFDYYEYLTNTTGSITFVGKVFTETVPRSIDLSQSFSYSNFQEFLNRTLYRVQSDGGVYYNCNQIPLDISVTGSSVNPIYKRLTYHYSSSVDLGSRYLNSVATAISASVGDFYSSSLQPTDYQFNENSAYTKTKFGGTQLRGRNFNVDSTDTPDGSPVVSFREVNSNELIV